MKWLRGYKPETLRVHPGGGEQGRWRGGFDALELVAGQGEKRREVPEWSPGQPRVVVGVCGGGPCVTSDVGCSLWGGRGPGGASSVSWGCLCASQGCSSHLSMEGGGEGVSGVRGFSLARPCSRSTSTLADKACGVFGRSLFRVFTNCHTKVRVSRVCLSHSSCWSGATWSGRAPGRSLGP